MDKIINTESSGGDNQNNNSLTTTFTESGIRKNSKTRILGCKEICIFQETDSTNIQAFKIASNGAPEGSIVIAECQTGGKGRFGRKWVSPSGKNLYLSIIVRPDIPAQFAPKLTLVTAVALSDTLEAAGAKNHMIKWPNDILFNDKKISGILTEMKGGSDRVDFIIIGVGVNLNSSQDDYTVEIKDSAVSLKDILGKEINRIEFLNSFLFHFETNYSEFIHGRFPEILSKWIQKSGIINRRIEVTNFDDVITGIVTEVTPEGNLMLQTADGIRHIHSGDINYI